MKTTISVLALAAILGLSGCGSDGSGTSYTQAEAQPTRQTTVYSGGGDVDIDDVNVGEGGTYINNGDGTVTYTSSQGDADVSITYGKNAGNSSDEPFDPDAYDPTYTPTECRTAGFFYCEIEHKCLPIPADAGACPADNFTTK